MSTESGHIDADEPLVAALARGESLTRAGRLCGKSLSTVRRRMADDDFRQRVQKARSELLESSAAALAAASREAVITLRHLLTAEGESIRLGASKAILELSVKFRESVELESRLAALESRIEGKSDANS